MELFTNANFDFLGKKWWFILPSLAVIVAGLASIVAQHGLLYGVDFKGGTYTEIRWDDTPQINKIRGAISSKLQAVTVVGAHGPNGSNEVIVSTALSPRQNATAVRHTIESELDGMKERYSILDFEAIGPQVSEDLRHQASMAVAGASGGMLLYLSTRFRLGYAVAAVLAMAHDAVITIGLFSLLHQEITLTVVAALLTLIGYSMNDTIVVFDRVRENRRAQPRETLALTINRSINQTLSRTVLTSGLTLLTALSLLVFGGPALRGFSLVLAIGIVVGTFSSVYIASPILLALEHRQSAAAYRNQNHGGVR